MTLGHCTSPLGTPKIQKKKKKKPCSSDLRAKKSIGVSIPACHAGDRGSIPRRGEGYPFSGYKQSLFLSLIRQGGNEKTLASEK